MHRPVLFALVLCSAVSAYLVSSRPVEAGDPLPSPCDLISNNPLVSMEIAGSTLSGSFLYERLDVKTDGTASYVAGGGLALPAPGAIQFTVVPPAAIADLRKKLRDAGAFKLCDLPEIVSDVPLTTVTVFAGEQDSRAHTFNYFGSPMAPNHAKVDAALRDFIAAHFPPNPIGG
jgi:hypothetical protein